MWLRFNQIHGGLKRGDRVFVEDESQAQSYIDKGVAVQIAGGSGAPKGDLPPEEWHSRVKKTAKPKKKK